MMKKALSLTAAITAISIVGILAPAHAQVQENTPQDNIETETPPQREDGFTAPSADATNQDEVPPKSEDQRDSRKPNTPAPENRDKTLESPEQKSQSGNLLTSLWGFFQPFTIPTLLVGTSSFLILRKEEAERKKIQSKYRELKRSNEILTGRINQLIQQLTQLQSYVNSTADGLRSEWRTDIRQSTSNIISSTVKPISDWPSTISSGDLLAGFSQSEPVPAPPSVSLQEKVKQEFGKNNSFFCSDRFQPIRARNAWQGVVNSEGVSALELEDCQAAEASYLRFSDAHQDYLIPNATNPRLRQQILQLEQENSSAFQIRVSPTGELKLHQAAKIARNGADSWSVIEPGLIER